MSRDVEQQLAKRAKALRTERLVVLTPGTIGPAFFREVAAAAAGGPPDQKTIAAIMDRHGLVPA